MDEDFNYEVDLKTWLESRIKVVLEIKDIRRYKTALQVLLEFEILYDYEDGHPINLDLI